MRPLRLLAPCDPENGFPVLYHITSRVVEKRFIFKERERAKFLKLAKDFAVFSGFELVSWCLMSNHFHLLVRVPVQDVEAISDQEMIRRLERILSPIRMGKLVARLNACSDAETRREILGCFRKRIGHLPSFVKAVKQEFSQWFNFVNQREGTLWEGRYHSTIVEDTGGRDAEAEMNGAGEIARIMASYIDMNPVRAKVENDPKDSDWSSYGAALRGDSTALRGLRVLWGLPESVDSAMPCENARLDAEERNREALARHRRWILRGENIEAAIEVAAGYAATPVEDDIGAPVADGRDARGRPPRLTGLRRVRVVGSADFRSRFGLATSCG